jgi:hypothetical protein
MWGSAGGERGLRPLLQCGTEFSHRELPVMCITPALSCWLCAASEMRAEHDEQEVAQGGCNCWLLLD